MRVTISYPFGQDTPLYPGTPAPVIAPYTSMDSGGSSNTTMITFHNHSGTHIDLPLHFCPGGASLQDYCDRYPVEFMPAYCINIEKKGDNPLLPEDFMEYEKDCSDAEALLVRTGSWRNRDDEGEAYVRDHPWVDPSVPGYLRNKFPQLRLFGIDTISVATPIHRMEGRDCHRNFLCGEKPVLLLEDADLSNAGLLARGFNLELYPFICSKIDGIPVIAVVFFD